MSRVRRALALAGMLAVVGGSGQAAAQTAPARRDIIVATTTSTTDTSLMDVLVPMFESRSGYRVKLISAGTGQTLTMGARGDADVVLGHAPDLERKYVAEGAFVNHRLVMVNDFVVVGPPADPLKLKGMNRLAEAFRRIAEVQAPFVSRGDQSGTHLRELTLWQKAGVRPAGNWYIQTGQGQGATLNVASERGAYALTDRGTLLALQKRLSLQIVLEKVKPLLNVYHVMEINPARHSQVNHAGGKDFADFLVSPAAQRVIGTFGMEKYGQPLFVPVAGKSEKEFAILDD
jgi:tungstate transport system substrate-binding protein